MCEWQNQTWARWLQSTCIEPLCWSGDCHSICFARVVVSKKGKVMDETHSRSFQPSPGKALHHAEASDYLSEVRTWFHNHTIQFLVAGDCWSQEEKEFRSEREEEKAINWEITALQAMEYITQRLKCHKEYMSTPELGISFFHHNYSEPPIQRIISLPGRSLLNLLSFYTSADSIVASFIHSINNDQYQWALTMYQLLRAY